MEISSPEASKELIKVGIGIGILADWVVEEDVNKGELVSLQLGKKNWQELGGISLKREEL